MEQAGFDRNLFENGGNKHRFVDVTYPEFVIPSCPYSSTTSNREERSHIQQLLTKEAGPFSPTLPETTRLAILPTWTTLSSTSDKSTSRRRSGKRRSWPPRSRNEGMYIRTWTGTHEFSSHSVRNNCSLRNYLFVVCRRCCSFLHFRRQVSSMIPILMTAVEPTPVR